MTRATEFAELMQSHRSIRQYKDTPLDNGLVDRVLEQAADVNGLYPQR